MAMSTRRALKRTGSSQSNVGGGGSSASGDKKSPPVVVPIPLRMSRRQGNPNQSNNNRLSSHNFLSQYSQLIDDKDKNLRMYFVIPEGKTRANCDSKLAIVFALCEDNNLDADWINEADCLKLTPTEGNIFILSPFDGPAFEYLEKCRSSKVPIEIIGPQCLHYALSRNKEPTVSIQNQGNSTLTVAMRGLLICPASMEESEKKSLKLKVLRMGGHYSSQFTSGVTHVIAKNITNTKCQAAFDLNLPVMKPDWVDQVWIDSQEDIVHATDEKYRKYMCPLFYNLSICVSQFPQVLKESYKKLIEEFGGKYTGDLSKSASILIVPNGNSQKFKAAQKWKIPCVIPEWLEDSKSAGHILPFDEYRVHVEKTDDEVRKISTPRHSMVELPPDKGIPKNRNYGLNDSVISCVDGTRVNYTVESQLHEEKGSNTLFPILDTRALDLASSKGVPYLDGCVIYVSGQTNHEKVKKYINSAGAIHLSALRKNVTHVLVTDNKLSPSELEKIEQLNIKPYIVSVKWLVASATKGSPEDEDLFALGNELDEAISETVLNSRADGSFSSHGSSKRNSLEPIKINQPQQENNLNQSNQNHEDEVPSQVSDHGVNVAEDIQIEEPIAGRQSVTSQNGVVRTPNNNLSQRSSNSRQPQVELQAEPANMTSSSSSNGNGRDDSECVMVFTDCKVKVALSDKNEEVEVISAIENADGVVVTGSDFDFIIFPVTYDPEEFPGLDQDQTKCVTKFWVTDSIERQTLISPNNREFHHKPVKIFNNMNAIMTDVVIAVTQYGNKEKNYIANLAEAMGAKYQEVFARRANKTSTILPSTHLICPNTQNDKYLAACKWGKFAVVAEWLIDSFIQKKKLKEAQYNPQLASDSDSQSQNSYIMPQTPKVNYKGSSHPGRTSTLSVMASSATKPAAQSKIQNETADPLDDKSPFKTPTSVAKKAISKQAYNVNSDKDKDLERQLQDPAFLEYLEKLKDDPNYNIEASRAVHEAKLNSPSFLAWMAEQRVLAGLPAEEQPSIEIEGLTTEEARNLRIALEVAGANTPPPNIYPKKKLPTPTSVVMKRGWKLLMERFPVENAKYPLTSTPKARKSSTSSEASAKSEVKSPKRNQSQGLKRASDSSLEDEVVLTGGNRSDIKRLRISSESEDQDTDISEIHYDQDKDQPDQESDLHVNHSGNSRVSEDEPSVPDVPFAGLVLWISKDCFTDELKSSVERCGGMVVDDFRVASVTHIIVEAETQAIAEAQERNENLKVVKPSWLNVCIETGLKVDENDHKSTPSSKRSARELADLLKLNDDDPRGMSIQKPTKNKNKNFSSAGNGDENNPGTALNPDEYDAPAVVWQDDESQKVPGRRNRLNLSPPPEAQAPELPYDTLASSRSTHKSKKKDKSEGDQAEPSKPSTNLTNTKSSSKSTASTWSSRRERARSEDRPKGYPIPTYPKFMLSGLTEQDKTTVEDSIASLGGEIIDSSTFTAEVDALITQRLARSEKVLASIAAGKFVLKPSYLEYCVENGRFMPVTENFLWKQGEGISKLEDEVAYSAHYWFMKSREKPPVKPFQNGKYFLYDQRDSKVAAYTRLILAGGGRVVSDIKDATIIIRNKADAQSDPIPIPPGIPVQSPLILSSTILIKTDQ